jgi:Protein of unknown function (DUF3048) C-terminal domain/Protein of unknown function (DUF3048) N-terminal domain
VRPVPVLTWSVLVVVIASLVVAAVVLTRPAVSGTCPLTGTPRPPGPSPSAPALAVKVDDRNIPIVQAQLRGLSSADLVFEEPIEPIGKGATRLVAVFNCSFPSTVGLVRGPRPTDPDLLAELGKPLFSFGKDDKLTHGIDLSGVVNVGEGIDPTGYSRTLVTDAPNNLLAKPALLLAAGTSSPPTAVFRYSARPPPGQARGLTVQIPLGNVLWQYDSGAGVYLRSFGDQPNVSDGNPISAANVIVQSVPIHNVRIGDQKLVRAETVGQGDAIVYRNGWEIPGTWSRLTRQRPPVFRDSTGAEIAMAPGITWIELVPAGSSTTPGSSPTPGAGPTTGSSPTPASGAPT